MSFSIPNYKYGEDFTLPVIENQARIFKEGFYKQELLEFEAGKERLVSILFLTYFSYILY